VIAHGHPFSILNFLRIEPSLTEGFLFKRKIFIFPSYCNFQSVLLSEFRQKFITGRPVVNLMT
jgi:hypothetical protein